MQLATSSHSHLVSVSMVQSGLFIIFLDTSFGHPYQSVCVPVLVHFSVDVVVPPAVKQNVSIVMSGDVRGPTV